MSERVKVVPCEGYEFIIGDPKQGHPIDGTMVEGGSYWTRDAHTAMLIRDGVVKVVDETDVLPGPSPGPETMFSPTKPGSPRS